VSNMAHRRITRSEFNYIKDLLAKYRKHDKVAEICGRSRSALRYIEKANNFSEYLRIRPGKTQVKKRKYAKRRTTKRVVVVPGKCYSGAILKMNSRMLKQLKDIYILIFVMGFIALIELTLIMKLQ